MFHDTDPLAWYALLMVRFLLVSAIVMVEPACIIIGWLPLMAMS